jgi:aminoglycoside phosphotransferase (APT) family kinase protein
MIEAENTKQFEQLVHRLEPESRLLRVWPLKGGVSAQVTALEVTRPDGQQHKLLVRQHGEADRQTNPQIAANEFRLLQILTAAGIPAPKPYFLDQSGQIFVTPYIVIEYIEGTSEFAPLHLDDSILQLAAHLARIHRLDCSVVDLSFLPEQTAIAAKKLRERPTALDDSLDEGCIRAALEAVWPWPSRNPAALLHGDFWPGNIVWQGGLLVAVIDWEDAALGDPLADLANSRLEILWAFGSDAMRRFTEAYQSLMPIDYSHLAYWDLYAALQPASKLAAWGLDATTEGRMRAGHSLFVCQALEKLAVS